MAVRGMLSSLAAFAISLIPLPSECIIASIARRYRPLRPLRDKLHEFRHRNRPAPVDGRNGRDVQLQPLNVVVERGRIRWNGRRQRSVRRPGTVAVRLHQDSLRRKIDHQQLISVGVALAGQSRFV